MNVTIQQPALGRALRLASRVISSKTGAPIMQCVLLTSEPDRLSLTTTDTQLGLTIGLAAETTGRAEVAVPARLLADYVGQLPAEPVHLTLDRGGKRVRAVCGRFTATFATADPQDFPRLPAADELAGVELDASTFREAITRVAFAAARDETRPVLTAVLLELGQEGVTLAATDGFRLARAGIPSKAASAARQLLVPARAIAEFARLSSGAKTASLLPLPDNQGLYLAADETRLFSRLVEGRFPELERVIPTGWRTRLTVETAALVKAVRVASLFGAGETHPTLLEVEPGILRLRARGDETGEAQSEVSVALEGESQAVAVNARLLGEVLEVVGQNQVELTWTTPQSPIVVRSMQPAADADLWLVMPLHDPALTKPQTSAA